jgi:hypothetical protein
MNDGADVDNHLARVERMKAKGINGNGAGIPLAVACRSSLPHMTTPQAGSECSDSGHGSRRRWSTPCVFDGNDGVLETLDQWRERNDRKRAQNPKLGELHLALGTQAIGQDRNLRLNPMFVEWLMGWPIGYSVSKHWVTGKSRSRQPRRG